MTDYGGFIHHIDEPDRRQLLEDFYFSEGNSFTEVISSVDWKPKQLEIFLLSLDGTNLDYASLAAKGRRVATGKTSIRLDHHVPLYSVPLDRVETTVNTRVRRLFSRASQGGGQRVPPATWRSVLDVLKATSGTVAAGIERLEALRTARQYLRRGPASELLAEEKDAATLALSVWGERSLVTKAFTPLAEDEPLSLFSNVTDAFLREDTMVIHDASVFSGWQSIREHIVGEAVFQRGNKFMSIVNVNRLPLENTLGVDLIYWNHVADAFVLVQYKRMLSKGLDGKPGYRPDSQLEEEQRRMEDFLADNPDTWSGSPRKYRLHSSPMFFKLCPARVFDPLATSLLPGFYVPLDLWKCILASDLSKGSRGGRIVTYDSAPIRLSNSQFIDLTGAGLIGSRGVTSSIIRQLIERSATAKRSVVAAEVF